jgi:DNA-directed RNA polymerase specialized sigma24 family protein
MEIIQGLSDKARGDLLLVDEAKKGNEKAFASLMNRYRDSIYYMVLKMVNNASDAEDLTIEAFGKAFRNLDSYTPKFAFSTWLFKIAILLERNSFLQPCLIIYRITWKT